MKQTRTILWVFLASLFLVGAAQAAVVLVTPNMTSDSTPAPNTTAANQVFSTHYAYLGVDRDTSTYWSSTDAPSLAAPTTLTFHSPFASMVSVYGLMGRRDITTDNQPTNWSLDGSNDGSAWTVIDVNSTSSFSGVNYYNISSHNSYSYYRLNVNAANTGATTVSEFTLYGVISPPVSSFTASPTSGTAPLLVQFNDTSSYYPTSWSYARKNLTVTTWQQFNTSQNPIQSFVAGNWSVNLTASNAVGSNISTQITWINVSRVLPISSFTATPTSGVSPLTVSFNDTSTGVGITSYNTSFGDGVWLNQTTFPAINISHIYSLEGSYTVGWYVTNSSGTGSATRTITVNTPASPISAFSGTPTVGVIPLTVYFTDSSTGSPSPSTWNWTFGDSGTSTLQNPSHIYNSEGTFSVSLNVTNTIGFNSTTKSNYIRAISNRTGNTRQDTLVSPLYPIVIYVRDSQTNNPITTAIVTDGLGNALANSGSGSFAGSYPYGINTFNVQAPNYYPTSVAESVLGASTFTVQLTGYGNVTSTSTVWYSPRTTQFSVVDVYGNQLYGATINAHYNSTTLPAGVSDLINNYGMNINAANEALNGTLIMNGTTDSMGSVTFTMMQTIKYDITVSYGGNTNTYSFYPQQANYQLKFVVPVSQDNIWNDLYANGNTKVWATEPDLGNVTFWWSFQDMTALTTRIDFYLKDVSLNTMVYQTNVTSPIAGGIYQLNYTVPNVRGKNYIAWENYTRNI